MTKYNTGNPVGSSDPRDFSDNTKNLDLAVNSSESEYVDRLGKTRLTIQGVFDAATTGLPAVGAAQDALASADRAEAQAEKAEQAVLDGIASGTSLAISEATYQGDRAESEADRAEAARDAAVTNGNVYTTVTAGEAVKSDGEYFWVVSGDESGSLELWLMGASSASDTGKKLINYQALVENGIENSNFESASGWSAGGATISVASNILSVTSNSVSLDPRAQSTTSNIPYAPGHKIYVGAKMKAVSTSVTGLRVWLASAGMTQINAEDADFSVDEFKRIGSVITAGAGGSGQFTFWFSFRTDTPVSELVGELKEVIAVDLTAAFGTGNEPTAADMDKLLGQYDNDWFQFRAGNRQTQLYLASKADKSYVDSAISSVGTRKQSVLEENIIYGKEFYDAYAGFVKSHLKQDRNLNVLLLGTSISAQYQGTTDYDNPSERPPMCFNRNLAGLIFDKVTWGNALYRRFDHTDIAVSGGTWVEKFKFPVTGGDATERAEDWGDIAVSQASETKYVESTAAATVEYDFPADAKICNFIYRTEQNGAEDVMVTVTGGAGLVNIVDNDGNAIADAHNYVFSTKETAGTATKNISKYQVRLRMKRVSGASTIPITITKPANAVANRLSFWGIEHSEDDYIVTVINEAVSGGDIATIKANIDSMIDDRDLDLILFEYPILNMGTANTPAEQYAQFEDIVFSANSYSLASKSNSFTDFKILVWVPHERSSGVTGSNTLVDGTAGYNAKDYRDYLAGMLYDNANVACINAFKRIMDDSAKIYGNYFDAWKASDVGDGATLTRDGTHPNDNGVALLCKYLLPALSFDVS